jgi:branched-chain amino acid transport system substrate-binding protein
MINRRIFLSVAAALALAALGTTSLAQGPVKVGMSMPQTGPLGAGGKAALLALQIWVEDVNKKGGLLGRRSVSFATRRTPRSRRRSTKLLDVDGSTC